MTKKKEQLKRPKRGRYNKTAKALMKKRIIEELVKTGGLITPVSESLHVDRGTIINWRAEDPEFDAACAETMEMFLDTAESKLFAAVRRGNLKAVKFFLERKGRSRGYDLHQDIDLTATVVRPRVIFEGEEEDAVQD